MSTFTLQAEADPQAPAQGAAKFDQVQGQVNEVKVILKDNINKVLERGDRLDDLIGKTGDLQASVSICYWWDSGERLTHLIYKLHLVLDIL